MDFRLVEELINTLMDEAHTTATEKGWHNEPTPLPQDIALMHSELSEALEDYRNHHPYDEIYFEGEKPCGIPVEFADVIIRILDTCKDKGIPLAMAITLKLKYNMTRSFKHGGKSI